ncbi:MAG: alpha-L-fucosidase [Saprospiraceae bacterium]
MKNTIVITLFFGLSLFSCQQQKITAPPAPVHPIPSTAQIEWQEMEFYAFAHFNMNTFSNMEWGYGDEKPAQFNPTELDCRQWARVAKEAGMTGIILTAKHHDGFCLWPSKYTEHSVKNSPWKNGKGDLVKDLAEACKEYGLKMGMYYSPWDRNHADYGKPEYLTYMRNQLREVLGNYGEFFEVWFDGANGGTGYYGGANEERKVDKKTYYDMQNTYPIIRELQPNAMIFSDAGPDIRWVGNEHGYAFETMWSNLLRDSVYAGMIEYSEKYASGQELGTHWVPGEADVSIRPGWYYHEYEDHKVRSLTKMLDMYYNSIGRNTTFLLNFPIDKRGLIHEKDVAQLQKLTAKIKEDFAHELAIGSRAIATNERGLGFEATNVVDGQKETYWATEDGQHTAAITIELNTSTTFNRFLVQEHIALGQRVKAFSLEAKTDNSWKEIATATTIGYKRILRLPTTTTTAVRLTIKDAKASPTISNIELYNAPKLVLPPTISRNKAGVVKMEVPEKDIAIYYTLDGSTPSNQSTKYNKPFSQTSAAIIQAIALAENKQSEVSRKEMDIAATKWQVVDADEKAEQVIDGKENSSWSTAEQNKENEIIIDLGETLTLKGFTYLPMQDRWFSGIIKDYAFYTSLDNKNWTLAKKGEFANIFNNPIWQSVTFSPQTARFIQLKALTTVDDKPATFAEVGVLTK